MYVTFGFLGWHELADEDKDRVLDLIKGLQDQRLKDPLKKNKKQNFGGSSEEKRHSGDGTGSKTASSFVANFSSEVLEEPIAF